MNPVLKSRSTLPHSKQVHQRVFSIHVMSDSPSSAAVNHLLVCLLLQCCASILKSCSFNDTRTFLHVSYCITVEWAAQLCFSTLRQNLYVSQMFQSPHTLHVNTYHQPITASRGRVIDESQDAGTSWSKCGATSHPHHIEKGVWQLICCLKGQSGATLLWWSFFIITSYISHDIQETHRGNIYVQGWKVICACPAF